MIIAISLNCALAFCFWFIVVGVKNIPKAIDTNGLQAFFVIASILSFFLSIIFFLTLACLNPGFVIRQFCFIELIETSLENGIHLDNLCVYDEVIKTETSFHCNFERRCVEMFDHHCPFINNCLGYNNHKYFLMFLISYTVYLMCVLIVTLNYFIHAYEEY